MTQPDLKQPHEGVRGVDRTGNDFLSLDPSAVYHRDVLMALARHFYTAIRVGEPAPVVQRMYADVVNPKVGDLVVENARGFYAKDLDTRLKAMGFLVERRREWWQTDEEYQKALDEGEQDPDDERPTDEAWYVQYGPDPGDICRWTNCDFIAIPIGGDYPIRAGVREGTKIVIQRDALRRTIIDAGFNLEVPGILDDALKMPR